MRMSTTQAVLTCSVILLAGIAIGLMLDGASLPRHLLAASGLEASETKAAGGPDEPGAAGGLWYEAAVRFSEQEQKEFGIETAVAGPGCIRTHLDLPGEIRFNSDRMLYVTPILSGVVREIRKTLGDSVHAGDVMAVLQSSELAEARAAYLAARERATLAEANFQREEGLRARKITSEQEYQDARTAVAEARITLRTAEQKLLTLGATDEDLTSLPDLAGHAFADYEVVAPLDGVVIDKRITVGQSVEGASEIFAIADLETVWADLRVHQGNLPLVKVGQPVTVATSAAQPAAESIISYIGPIIGEDTRTALARVVLPNPEGQWLVGMYVTARVVTSAVEAPVVIPRTALQTVDGRSCVFINTDRSFELRFVQTGREDPTSVEIRAGLDPGQQFAATGAFTLRAEMEKDTFVEDDD